jgi:hypothetical protein
MKLQNRLASFVLALALPLAACGGSSGSTAAAEPTTPAAASGDVLQFAEATILKGDQEIFKLHADGTTEARTQQGDQSEWVKGPTFTTDGKVKLGDEEKAHLTGTEIIANGAEEHKLPFAIAADKVIAGDGAGNSVEFSLDDQGVLSITGTEVHGDPVRVQAATAQDRHAGLVVFTATFVMLNGMGKMHTTPTSPTQVPASPTN